MQKMESLFLEQLYTPGPISLPADVLLSGSRPMIHHRTDAFSAILENVVEKMKLVFGATGVVLPVHTTGRGAMEGALRNLLAPGEKILCVCNGYFGEMFAEIGRVAELTVSTIYDSWIEPIDLGQLDERLKNDPGIKAVTVVHSDTSNALINPIASIGEIVRAHNRFIVVDCISSLGVMPFQFDDWKVDVAVTASQKGLMAPAGLSFVAVSERAMTAVSEVEKRSFYIDFQKIKDFYETKRETPGSTPVSLIRSVEKSLELIFRETLEKRYQRHANLSKTIKRAVTALGLELFPAGDFVRTESLTAFSVPSGLNAAEIKKTAQARYHTLMGGGFGKYKGNTMRIAHMGMMTLGDAVRVIAVLEVVLFEMGYLSRIGRGLEAVNKKAMH